MLAAMTDQDVVIGSRNTIRESVTINRGVVDGTKPPVIKKKRADAA